MLHNVTHVCISAVFSAELLISSVCVLRLQVVSVRLTRCHYYFQTNERQQKSLTLNTRYLSKPEITQEQLLVRETNKEIENMEHYMCSLLVQIH